MSIEVKLENKEDILNAIKDVRKDDTPTNWVLIGHARDDPNTLELAATGTDGFEGLSPLLSHDKVFYALLRVTTKVDLSVTVKFVYIHHVGEEVGFAKRGRFSVVHGAVVKYFQPFHVDFDITERKEISPAIIRDKVEKAAGKYRPYERKR
jgi:drebrin-like protein